MKYAILSCSLKPDSRSRILARYALERLHQAGADVDYVDLRDLPLPHCGASASRQDTNVGDLKQRLVTAHGILIAAPIYNFDFSSTAKNVVELTGREAWSGKVAGFMCAAGGRSSYMSPMGLANSLMLDFRTVILPRFVYATKSDFEADRIASPAIRERLDELTAELVRFTTALLGPAESGS